MTDPLRYPCPVCGSSGRKPCIALDYRALPSDHAERSRPRFDPAQEASPIYAETAADLVTGSLEPYASADHEDWSLRAYDDLDGSHLRLVVTRAGKVVKEGVCATYKVWTVLAHWTDDLPTIEAASRG